MITFTFRLRFFTHAAGVIRYEGRTFDFTLPDGHLVTLSCLDCDSIGGGREFVVTGSGFETREAARGVGESVKSALLLVGPRFKIGIDAGNDRASSGLGPQVREDIRAKYGIAYIDNVHGLSIYSDEYPVKTFSGKGAGLTNPQPADQFSAAVGDLYGAPIPDNRIRLALELYGAAHYEKSDRARFLTFVVATESILELEDRSEAERQVVHAIIESVRRSDLTESQKRSMEGTLRYLYQQSISQALKGQAVQYLSGAQYSGMPAAKFIGHCYTVRSKLVHTGKVDSSVHLGALAANLDLYLSDLLRKLTGT